MTTWNLIAAGLKQYRRVHLAVAAGVAVATAVITGALLVGSSMRGSLRDLALSRLGRIDTILVAQNPFSEELPSNALGRAGSSTEFTGALPLILSRGSVSRRESGTTLQATEVSVYGIPEAFLNLGESTAKDQTPSVASDEVLLTANVAVELKAQPGDRILLRIPTTGGLPADSALGEKDGAYASRRFKVKIAESELKLAGFGLTRSQRPARNAFISLGSLQDLLELEGKANAAVFATKQIGRAASPQARDELRDSLQPTLSDLGLQSQRIEASAAENLTQVSAERLVLPGEAVEVVREEFAASRLQPAVTYLANTIRVGDKSVPYSTITGVDSMSDIGPLLDAESKPIVLSDDEVVLNDWAAKRLNASAGDEVTITYYEPETSHGELKEASPLKLRLKAIVPLQNDEGERTLAADPLLTPELPGVTDQDSINDWDLPFELVEKIEQADEDYWEEYRTTPKAFVSHGLAARLWGTRWGTESVLRVEAAVSLEEFSSRLASRLDPAAMGMSLIGVKEQAIEAASGTTPFDGLFLGFSFFIMASAVLLIALLFQLGVQQRASELGLLKAVGYSPRQASWALLGEGAIVADLGAALGVLLGIGYARLMIYGLNTWWVAATVEPFLELHVPWWVVIAGWALGFVVALATIAWTLRSTLRLSPKQLLAGQSEESNRLSQQTSVWPKYALWSCFALAIVLGIAAMGASGETQAGVFFGGGSAMLVGLLLLVRGWLRQSGDKVTGGLSLAGLSLRNTRRNPGRTLITLALAASASFLIVALGAFRLAPTDQGTGGYDLWATTDLPLLYDLRSEEGRTELGFSQPNEPALAAMKVAAFRVSDGEDASCLNLYQTSAPRVLGVPEELSENDRFSWGTISSLPSEDSPWSLLQVDLGNDESGLPIIPLILDRNTAYYSLKLYSVGSQFEIEDSAGRKRTLQVVGMLTNSFFQGDLLVSEEAFLRLYPETAGHRLFLIKAGGESDSSTQLAEQLESQLVDYGFSAEDARQRLADFLAVQNTYLSTFQSLGSLGLLLGVAGLAVAQLRSVAERRGELALMRATGFPKRKLVRMIFGENLTLLLGGLGIGCLSAAAVVLPLSLTQATTLPWRTLSVTLATIVIAGAIAGWLATRRSLQAPLLPSLRGD
ncbi:MAG: ABC transporter permease [Lacipirellulaceae bacterium]